MAILAVGSIALDSVKTPFGHTEEDLGGSATHFTAAASFFSKVHMVGVVGSDFPHESLGFLKARGVDLSAIEVAKGRTFRWKGEYGFDLNVAHTLDTQLNVFANFKPKIPNGLKRSEFLFLGNIHPKLQSDVLKQVKRPKLVALDTMNFWISGEPRALRNVISQVDLVVINEGEARELTSAASLVQAARTIRKWGPETVVIKRGEYGALLFHGGGVFSAPGLPIEKVKDPTGAGDSFAGGFMGYLAMKKEVTSKNLRQAVIVGSAMASFNVEEFSCRRLKTLSKADINRRIGEFQNLAHFPPIKI